MAEEVETRIVILDAFAGLTSKQHQVLSLIAENHTSKEIAFRLGISESAVNQRIECVRNRIGSLPRAELARAYRQYMQDAESRTVAKDGARAPVRRAADARNGGIVRTMAMAAGAMAAGFLVLATVVAGAAGRRSFLSGFPTR